MGINLGSFLSSFICGMLGIYVGWGWGFGAAGIGMLIGLVIFLVGQPWLEGRADPPSVEKLKEKVLGPINVEMACYLTGIIIVAVSFSLVMYAELIPDGLVLGLGILIFIGLVAYCFISLSGIERKPDVCCNLLCSGSNSFLGLV